MTQEMKVQDLQNVSSIAGSASLLALTDNVNNTVNLITKSNFINNIISSTANNGLISDANGLYVVNTGNLSNLDTTDKTSLVNAINEVVEKDKNPVTTLATSGAITLADNSVNKITPTGNIAFTLPTVTDTDYLHQILIQMKLTSSYTVTLNTNYFFNLEQPTFSNTGLYNIIYEYDNIDGVWVCGAMYKGEVE